MSTNESQFVLEHGVLFTKNYSLTEFAKIANEFHFNHKLSQSLESLFIVLFTLIDLLIKSNIPKLYINQSNSPQISFQIYETRL